MMVWTFVMLRLSVLNNFYVSKLATGQMPKQIVLVLKEYIGYWCYVGIAVDR